MDIAINYYAVVGAAVGAIVVGALWYGPLFQKPWMQMAGLTMEGMKSMKMGPVQAMIGGALVSLLMAYVLAHVMVFAGAYTNSAGISAGLMAAFWNWLGFVVPVTAGVFLWEGKSWKLWVLNAGYYLVSLMVMGAILGAFPAI